ncbi:MAG TPA: PBP1A family penicillin-binding protein [Spirochaetia bacterium]|nr:PBP1A family penicillin-binding protein [Spirochaetia bacterium]
MARKSRKLTIRPLIIVAVLAAVAWGGWTVYGAVATLPSISSSLLGPPPVTQVFDANQQLIAVVGTGKANLSVPLSQMPQPLIQAVLATEDVRFYENSGFDFRSFMRSAWYDISHLSLSQGGSTITEQLANNAFLANNHQTSFKRKIQQFILSMELTHQYTKDEILEMYLNKIYFGSGAWGIGEASEVYFGTNPDKLTLAQAALLAGLPQSPSYYSPLVNPKAALTRRNEVLGNMLKYNFITQAQYNQAMNGGLQLHPNLNQGYSNYPYATDYILQQLGQIIGSDKVYQGGLKVYTTINATVQKAAQDALANEANFPSSAKDKNGLMQPEGAAVFVDQHTGGIEAIAGGREHNMALPLDRAVQSYRQPGSSIKPFLDYGPAIEYDGLTPDSLVQDTPLTIANYSPQNFDNTYLGPVTLRFALTNSINVVAVRLLDMVTIPKAVQFASQSGITIANADQDGLAIALGGMSKGVTPLEMAGGYATIANGGVYIQPHVIKQVVTDGGAYLYNASPDTHTAMQPYTDWALTSMMQSVVQEGTGTGAAIPNWPVAGKTGTTTEGKDLWFDGFTPVLTGVVWIGYDSPTPMPQGYGGIYAARVWRQIMTTALAGQTPQDFTVPPGVNITPPATQTPGTTQGASNQGIPGAQTGQTGPSSGYPTGSPSGDQGATPQPGTNTNATPGTAPGKMPPSGLPTAFQPDTTKGDEFAANNA